jgi:hypothetical protein
MVLLSENCNYIPILVYNCVENCKMCHEPWLNDIRKITFVVVIFEQEDILEE